LSIIDAAESEQITVAERPDDRRQVTTKKPERHPIAIALRRKRGVDDPSCPGAWC
jgi:hypothetical protein